MSRAGETKSKREENSGGGCVYAVQTTSTIRRDETQGAAVAGAKTRPPRDEGGFIFLRHIFHLHASN